MHLQLTADDTGFNVNISLMAMEKYISLCDFLLLMASQVQDLNIIQLIADAEIIDELTIFFLFHVFRVMLLNSKKKI